MAKTGTFVPILSTAVLLPSVFPTSGKESACQCRRLKRWGFDPWVKKIPWSRKWQPTLVFLPGKIPWTEEPSRLQSMGSQRVRQDWATEHVSLIGYWFRVITIFQDLESLICIFGNSWLWACIQSWLTLSKDRLKLSQPSETAAGAKGNFSRGQQTDVLSQIFSIKMPRETK